jgi:hypothetical protein
MPLLNLHRGGRGGRGDFQFCLYPPSSCMVFSAATFYPAFSASFASSAVESL